MDSKWLIVGISGVTCGGKTTLAKEILELLPGTEILYQDDYFLPEDSEKHILVPELNHFNWELLSSLDMEKMYTDIQNKVKNKLINADIKKFLDEFNKINSDCATNRNICKNTIHSIQNKLVKYKMKILILEGFSIFNYQPIDEICHLKFFLTLSREICYQRRSKRTYIPPDVPGYFEKCVWPEYQRQLEEVQQKSKNVVFLTEKMDKKTIIVMQYLFFFFEKLA